MAPLVPRMHLFEIDDQPWFPSWFRGKVQAALTQTWNSQVPFLQPVSPARIVSRLLQTHLKDKISDHVFIDFCAGGGGPTPSIERSINKALKSRRSPPPPAQFVLTDLHPHIENWTRAASRSPNIHFSPYPIDASAAPPDLLTKHLEANNPLGNSEGKVAKKQFRLFNLAFHHFDDPLARRILANTLETSDGFAIFELQDRSLRAFLSCCLLGIGVMFAAPYFAWRWRSLGTLFWCWVIPVLPFVLVYDGWVSSLRTRTPGEVEALMRTCGVDEKEVNQWELRSGRECHLPPVADLNWIICTKKTSR